MLGTDAGVVESRGDRVRRVHLTVFVLQEIAHRAVQHAGLSLGERCGVLGCVQSVAGRFDADEFDVLVGDKRVENPDRVRPAAHARDHGSRQCAGTLEHLRARLVTDDRLKISHHSRIRRGTDHRSNDVVALFAGADPVANGFARGVLQRPCAGRDGHHGRAHHAHPKHVQCLPAHVLLTHVDDAVESEPRAYGGGRHAMLARASLRDDAPLAHPLREQSLRERIVDFVRSRVVEIFPFQPDRRANALRPARRIAQWRRPAGVMRERVPERLGKHGIAHRVCVCLGQRVERRNQRFGHITSAERTKAI